MPQQMPLKPTTIRFAEDGAEMIQQAADEVGCSFAQFVREAALIRAAIVTRSDLDFKRLSDRIARLARRDD